MKLNYVLFFLILMPSSMAFDLDNNGIINIDDLSILITENFGSEFGDVRFDSERDFNTDSYINILDALLLINRIDSSTVYLSPEQRSLTIDFSSISGGENHNTEIVNGELVLSNKNDVFSSEGYWISPVYDTQNQYVMWDWVYEEVDYSGMQENLIDNGDFEELCTNSNGDEYPCTYYFPSTLKPPFVDSSDSTSGDYSMRFEGNNSYVSTYYYMTKGTDYWTYIDQNKPIHLLFDMKHDTDGIGTELWISLNEDTTNLYHGIITKYNYPVKEFKEQYFTIDSAQFNSNGLANKMKIKLFQYFQNDDYPTTFWMDNLRIFQDSPLSFQVRTSSDGVEWTDWNDERFFLPEKTAPGGIVNRYIQFKINLKNFGETTKSPKVRKVKLDYSKSFPFPISWDYKGPSVFDEAVENIDDKGDISINSEGNFEFSDGEKVRFWSMQINDFAENYFDFSQQELVCKKIKQLGFNMIKVTHAQTNSFYNFVKECKDEGIYIYTQLGGVFYNYVIDPEGSAANMLSRMSATNPYTGIALKDDPQFLLLQLLNEVSFHSVWKNNGIGHAGVQVMYSGIYNTFFNQKWDEWLLSKYPSYEDLVAAWDDGTGTAFYPIESGENYPENINRTEFSYWETMSHTRFKDTSEFYADIHEEFYSYTDNLFEENNVKGFTVPNNHYYGMSELSARKVADIMDQHSYFPYKRVTIYSEIMQETTQSQNPTNNIINYAALDDVKGYPLTISESNHNFPNLYAAEMPLFVSSYASFHDWDMWTYFKVFQINPVADNLLQVPEAYSSWWDSGRMALMPAASRIFRNEYVSPGSTIVELEHSKETVNDYQFNSNSHNFNVEGLNNDMVMKYRFTRANFSSNIDKTFSDYQSTYKLEESDNGIYVSETGELTTNSNTGEFTINSPKAQGFTGFTPESLIVLNNVNINIPPKGNNFSAIIIVSLDELDISDSQHLLLTATGRTEASGTEWKADKRGYTGNTHHYNTATHYGYEPVLVEGINAEISLKIVASSVEVNILDSNGQRTGRTLAVNFENSEYKFNISDMDETLWYEIIINK